MTQTFDPHQYALECGWDMSHIQATADQGVAEYDAERLTEEQAETLLAWCKQRVKGERE